MEPLENAPYELTTANSILYFIKGPHATITFHKHNRTAQHVVMATRDFWQHSFYLMSLTEFTEWQHANDC